MTFPEKLLLTLYRKFFGKSYDCADGEKGDHGLLRKHINAQCMMFLFSCLRVPVNYGFSWDIVCPWSAVLEHILCYLDSKPELVEQWYANESETTLSELLNSVGQTDAICKTCDIVHTVLDIPNGVELIADMLYLYNAVVRYFGYAGVMQELARRCPSVPCWAWAGLERRSTDITKRRPAGRRFQLVRSPCFFRKYNAIIYAKLEPVLTKHFYSRHS